MTGIDVELRAMIHKAKNIQRGQIVGRLKFARRDNPPQPTIIRKMVVNKYGRNVGLGVIG